MALTRSLHADCGGLQARLTEESVGIRKAKGPELIHDALRIPGKGKGGRLPVRLSIAFDCVNLVN